MSHPPQGSALTPYGYTVPGYAAPMQQQGVAAVVPQRAADKLERIRAGVSGDMPTPFPTGRIVGIGLLMAVLSLPFFLLGGASISEGEPLIAMILFPFGFAALAVPVVMVLRARSNNPAGVLRAYYRALSRGQHKRARELVTRADLDSFPRFQPLIHKLGRPTGMPLPFESENSFAHYWNELLRSSPSPYCVVRVSKVEQTELAPDVVLVTFRIRLIMNSSLWLLLIFVALILAIIVDLATRRTVKADVSKLLVKVGDDWKVFNAEWQGLEEIDLGWLLNDRQRTPARSGDGVPIRRIGRAVTPH
jgi:hypothetical protein